MGKSQLYRIAGRGTSMCKGPEVGKVFMCASSRETVQQSREGRVKGRKDQEVAGARPKGCEEFTARNFDCTQSSA